MARPEGAKDLQKRKLRATPKSDILIGKRIGRWLVVEKIQKGREICFKVKCDCGTEAIRTYTTIAYNAKKPRAPMQACPVYTHEANLSGCPGQC